MAVNTMTVLATNRYAVPPEPVLPLTVDQYHEMARAGILFDGDPIELLEGWLVTRMTKHPSHSAATTKIRRRLERIIPDGWSVETQEPVTTADSEPEPDLSVIRGYREEDYTDHHPGPDDVGLLVEVADTSLERDRGWKKRIYAAARIRTYWIVNLIDRQVEVFTQPTGPGEQPDYAVRQVFRAPDTVPVVLDERKIAQLAIEDLLP